MTLTELAIKRPSLVVVLFAILGIMGLFGYSQLNYNLLPKFSPPFVSITTIYPGAAPQEVETTVTKIIEDAVSGVDKISSIISRSYEGVSSVQIEFTQSAKTDIALQDVIRMVNQVLSQLPQGTKQPVVTKFNPDELPILRMGATSTMKSREFYQFLQDYIKPELAKIAGVGNITLIGGEKREVKVNLDAEKVRAYGLSLTQIQQAINLGNLDFPTGNIKESSTQYVVRIAGKYTSVKELSQLIVGRSRQGGDIRLSDIADVTDGVAEHSTFNRINNEECVGMYIQKQSDANAVEMSKLVKKRIVELIDKYKDIKLNIDVASDSSNFTLEAANAVQYDLMLAILIVAAVMFLFLHSLRNSLIVMVSIPASLISTFVFIWAFGFSLNLMTLLGLSLVIGILVDDSIVVLENIYHHLEKGEDKVSASIKGRNEIGFAALSITLVDVAVFLPLSLVTGLIGNIMREFALVVVISTLMSLVVSFTITPILASRFAKVQELSKNSIMGRIGLLFEAGFTWIQKEYGMIIQWVLKNALTKALVIVLSLSTFLIIGALFSNKLIPVEFITQSDRGEFAVTVEFPPSLKVEETNRYTQQIESMLFEMPEIKRVLTNVGTSSSAFAGTQVMNNLAELNVFLVPLDQRKLTTDQVGNNIKKKIMDISGAKVRVNPIGIFGSANESPVQVVISGANRETVAKGAKYIEQTLLKTEGTSDVRLSSEDGKLETRVEVDRQKLSALGLTIGEVGSALRIALQGNDDVKYREGVTEYDIRIRLDEEDRSKTAEIGSMTVQNRMGQQIEIQQFATIYQTTGATKLERRDRIPAVVIYAQPVGKGAADIATELDAKIKDKLPEGTSYTYIGDVKNAREGFGDMGIAMLGGIIFVYLIMVALYDSYFYPLVNLFSVFVAPFGAFLALALGMRSMSIFTMLGLIMLIGLVMKNAILLVDRANSNRLERGMDLRSALIEAGETRLRPIVMTTVAMIFGMFPIAFSHSAGSEWKAGLALALIGGLTSSMFLTLVLVPVIYYIFTRLREIVGIKNKTGFSDTIVVVPHNHN